MKVIRYLLFVIGIFAGTAFSELSVKLVPEEASRFVYEPFTLILEATSETDVPEVPDGTDYSVVGIFKEPDSGNFRIELIANEAGTLTLPPLSMDTPERLEHVLERSRELTERTGTAVRHCINLQEANDLFGSLPDDMRRSAQRIMADTEYDIAIEGEEFLDKLKPKTRADLFLFFKESLVNISRHAKATRFNCHLIASSKEIFLEIRDNGKGMSDSAKNEVPASLKRRAHLLGATVSAGLSASGGTRITLILKPRKFRIRK